MSMDTHFDPHWVGDWEEQDPNEWDCEFCRAVNFGEENWCHDCGKHYLESMLKKKAARS